MKATILLLIICSLLGIAGGCSGKKSGAKFEEVGPRIKAGFYSSAEAEDKNIPAVAIQVREGSTYAYSLLWYECEGTISASYSQSGRTFSDNAVSAGGPGVRVLGRKCDIESDIRASSPTTIQVIVKINGVAQTPYVLSSVPKETFVNAIKQISNKADKFSVTNETCEVSLGVGCDKIQIAEKN